MNSLKLDFFQDPPKNINSTTYFHDKLVNLNFELFHILVCSHCKLERNILVLTLNAQTSLGWYGNFSHCHISLFKTAECKILAPFGVPVEPDVYKTA